MTAAVPAAVSPETLKSLEDELAGRHGEEARARAKRGLAQAASLWRASDGDAAAFAEMARTHFLADPAGRDALFTRMQKVLESVDGHLLEVTRDLREHSDLDRGEILAFDEAMAGWDPSAHVLDDLFGNRLAFAVLLNFPLTTLPERLEKGPSWSRREWAEARLAQRFGKRIPAEVNQAVSEASADAARYIAGYNLRVHHLLDEKGRRLFPQGKRLLSHWNLRDEIKACYGDAKDGLAKQRTIARAMERIVNQTIPVSAIDSPWIDWNPFTNEVKATTSLEPGAPPIPKDLPVFVSPETVARYAKLLSTFRAARLVDPYSPSAPSLIARRFQEDRELPEARVRAMLEGVLFSPVFAEVGALVKKRLGRPLEPFDVWYPGFRDRGPYTEAQLDAITRERYPTPEAFEKDIPRILRDLGFPEERARAIASSIVVDPARGSGHAWGAARRGDKSHLRTRVGKEGMDYKGYNIAVHELGHNVEQTVSLNLVDHTLLAGVPNTAFTEAMAFVFQERDLELLGLKKGDAKGRALATLNTYWGTAEIAGVALVDMAVWHWMYKNPEATPAQLQQAVLASARQVWNRFYAPVFGVKDSTILAIYSHMIDSFLYLPDYPLGHLIAFQVERHLEKETAVGPEIERMAKQGRLTPDLWMKGAVGAPVGPEALLQATTEALTELNVAR
ncbi:MAG: hypothetical protein IPL90_09470 [Holophagales bacterium]|nr:hypothetical protein [Holophagales bacterium]